MGPFDCLALFFRFFVFLFASLGSGLRASSSFHLPSYFLFFFFLPGGDLVVGRISSRPGRGPRRLASLPERSFSRALFLVSFGFVFSASQFPRPARRRVAPSSPPWERAQRWPRDPWQRGAAAGSPRRRGAETVPVIGGDVTRRAFR